MGGSCFTGLSAAAAPRDILDGPIGGLSSNFLMGVGVIGVGVTGAGAVAGAGGLATVETVMAEGERVESIDLLAAGPIGGRATSFRSTVPFESLASACSVDVGIGLTPGLGVTPPIFLLVNP